MIKIANIFARRCINAKLANMSTIKFAFKLRDGTLKQVEAEKGKHIL